MWSVENSIKTGSSSNLKQDQYEVQILTIPNVSISPRMGIDLHPLLQ
ncbi:hypothetical protein Mucpa_6908 [Mucilaginibacter paludis DSM 18603]|uniref:Uncharacterized protein n=1 Tax=Mucilaginibacter paludis DSM 18603 TaxID=714943 RepID=H1Y412_9SPHI|nr:hypothetical protein Mucpa_6908 [Mucilaginibacter paludis DSM 18603]